MTFDPFQHFMPDEAQIHAIQAIRLAFRACQLQIEANCPESRERSTAVTNLETAAMWAIKSIVIQDKKPAPPPRNF